MSEIVYCRGCRHAWIDNGGPALAHGAVPDFGKPGECRCTCADDTDPHYEDWAVKRVDETKFHETLAEERRLHALMLDMGNLCGAPVNSPGNGRATSVRANVNCPACRDILEFQRAMENAQDR